MSDACETQHIYYLGAASRHYRVGQLWDDGQVGCVNLGMVVRIPDLIPACEIAELALLLQLSPSHTERPITRLGHWLCMYCMSQNM